MERRSSSLAASITTAWPRRAFITCAATASGDCRTTSRSTASTESAGHRPRVFSATHSRRSELANGKRGSCA